MKEVFGNDSYERIQFHRCRLKRMESNLLQKLSHHFQSEISKIFVVMDFAKFSVSDFYVNRAFNVWNLKSMSQLHPETMHKLFIFNAPWSFQMIWNICKQFVDDITLQKTIILGADYMDELLKHISIEMIPKEFGGKGIWT